jgi:hypothetical protein
MGEPGSAAPPDGSSIPESASLIELLLTVLQSLGALLAGKLRLAEKELSLDLGTLGRVAGLIAGVAVLLVLALGLAGVGLAILLAPWIGSTGGAFLLVSGIYLAGGLAMLWLARRRVRGMGGFLSESRADLKRDAEWLKNLS